MPLRWTRLANFSLLGKTLLLLCASSLLVTALIVAATLNLTRERAEQQAMVRLNALIDSTGAMVSASCFAQDAMLAKETAQAFVKNTEVRQVVIFSDHLELARATRSPASPSSQHNALAPLRRDVYSPFDPEEMIGEVVVEPDWDAINQAVAADVRYTALLLVMVAAMVIGLIAVIVSVLVIQPVKQISDHLHVLNAAGGENLSVPRGHESNELGRLVIDINDLIGRLLESLQLEHESHLQRVIHERLKLAAEVFDNSQEGIMVTDRDNCIVTVNPAFTAITGYSAADVIGQNPRILSSGRQNKAFYQNLWETLARDGFWRGELWNRRKDGEVIPKWFSINTVRDAEGKVMNHVAIFSDISDRKEAEERIEFLAHHDPLTALPNRVLLRDRFLQARTMAQRYKQGIALLFLDLDNFKSINDTFGHHAGDEVLISVVSSLSKHIRNSDTVCRQGGDEFILILPDLADLEIISRVAQNILSSLSAPILFEGKQINVSASIGIALFPEDGDEFEVLLRHADAAMYDAKMSGKNAFKFYTEDMNRAALDKLRLRASLHDAVRNQEFEVYYQPQINTVSGHIVGVEALIRWQHPALGLVTPDRFIPLAEESGLIIPIGEWVLEVACQQAQRWTALGLAPISMAVNVSAFQFNRGILLDLVKRALEASGLPPHQLELEITESALLYNMDSTLSTIHALKAIGVKFSIDDFGTGYSSLAYLKQIKVDKLKIDKSFIRDIGFDPDDLAIVKAVIQLGKTLQLQVIAEGVENAAQLAILKLYGCDEVQGFQFGRPMPADELTALLQSRLAPPMQPS